MSSDLFLKHLRPRTVWVSASYTRPADTTQYTAGDVVGHSTSANTALTFAGCARGQGQGGIINGAILVDSGAPSLKADLELFLFNDTFTIQNDNAAWAPSTADLQKCVGSLRFAPGLFHLGSSNGVYEIEAVGKSFTCKSDLRDLYGVLVARNSYTPLSGETFTVRLSVVQD